jgi:hypothetical protein
VTILSLDTCTLIENQFYKKKKKFVVSGKAAALGILEKNEDIKSVPFFWTMMYSKSIRYTGKRLYCNSC